MKRILIAEDNDSNYLLMSYILKGHYDCLHAHNGQEAVEMTEKDKPDLILMDIKMPLMDGLEASRQIRGKDASIPIIALSANAFDSDREAALTAGCNDFLSKPISSKACLEMIAKYLE
jgi:CheY-like chemotaxis protein